MRRHTSTVAKTYYYTMSYSFIELYKKTDRAIKEAEIEKITQSHRCMLLYV